MRTKRSRRSPEISVAVPATPRSGARWQLYLTDSETTSIRKRSVSPPSFEKALLPKYFLRVSDLIADLPGRATAVTLGSSRVVVAGGTDLYVQRPDELLERDVWVLPIETGDPIWQDENHIYLAATATAEDMKRSEILEKEVGGIESAMRLMGSLPIRQRATIAGNIVNASPIGDMTVTLLALDAEIGLVAGENHRSLPLRDFFIGYKDLDLRPVESLSNGSVSRHLGATPSSISKR